MKRKKAVDIAAEGIVEISRRGGELVATTIKLTKEVWEAAKIRAIREGITLAEIVERSLREYLEKLEGEG